MVFKGTKMRAPRAEQGEGDGAHPAARDGELDGWGDKWAKNKKAKKKT